MQLASDYMMTPFEEWVTESRKCTLGDVKRIEEVSRGQLCVMVLC